MHLRSERQERLDEDLQAAAGIQKSLLPLNLPINGIYEAMMAFGGGFPIQDDVSILGIAR